MGLCFLISPRFSEFFLVKTQKKTQENLFLSPAIYPSGKQLNLPMHYLAMPAHTAPDNAEKTSAHTTSDQNNSLQTQGCSLQTQG